MFFKCISRFLSPSSLFLSLSFFLFLDRAIYYITTTTTTTGRTLQGVRKDYSEHRERYREETVEFPPAEFLRQPRNFWAKEIGREAGTRHGDDVENSVQNGGNGSRQQVDGRRVIYRALRQIDGSRFQAAPGGSSE